jgi:AcrR family transcriptional regulator
VPRTRRSGDSSDGLNTRRGTLNEARWEEILTAAAEEFNERGYKAARLQDIAARVGMLTGSLYYYIDNKEDLLYALAESSLELGLESTTEDELTANSDAATRLRAFIQRQMQIMDRLRGPAGGIERELASLSPEHREKIDVMRRELHGFARSIIEQGVEDGDFDPEVDVGVATNTLFELLNTTRQWVKPGRRTLAEIGDWYARMLIRGLALESSLDRPGVADVSLRG